MKNKLAEIRKIIAEKDIGGVLIEKQANFSWLTGGRGFIGLASENSCGALLITKDGEYILASNIEQNRLIDEELPNGFTPLTSKWYGGANRGDLINSVTNKKIESDATLAKNFYEMRTVLDGGEFKTYEKLGFESADALETAVKNIRAGMTEFELAANISAELWSRGIEPITLLTAFDGRIAKYRHPLPTRNKLENVAVASICARYRGLVVSATRVAYLGSPANPNVPADLRARHNAVAAVDGALIKNTRPGAKAADLFELIRNEYAKHGYPGEEQLHHQGGLTGYGARENIISPNGGEVVKANQAYAWNPTVTGTKSEDTIFVGKSENIILSHTGNWRYINAGGFWRPDILIL